MYWREWLTIISTPYTCVDQVQPGLTYSGLWEYQPLILSLKTFKLEMNNLTNFFSLQIVYYQDKSANWRLFVPIIQSKSQIPDLIFSGELRHGISF